MIFNERFCYQCKKPLIFNEYKKVNPTLSKEKIKALWNNPYIQFYCCDCYTESIRMEVKRFLSNDELFENSLKSHSNPTVWRRFAIICYDRGEYYKTKKAYKRVLELDPSDMNTWRNLGHLYREEEKFNKAIKAYKRVLELDKFDANTITYLTSLYKKNGVPLN